MLKNPFLIINDCSKKNLKLKISHYNFFKANYFQFRQRNNTNKTAPPKSSTLNNIEINKENENENIKDKNNSVYYAKSDIAFVDGKFSLIQTKKSMTIKFSKINKYFINFVSTVAGVVTVGSLLMQNYSVAWYSGIVTLITLYLRWILLRNLSRLTIEINLLNDGTNVEIVTFSKRFVADIKSIKLPNKIQTLNLLRLNPSVANENTPFIVEDGPNRGFYYIPPSKEIEKRMDLLHAIFNKDSIVFQNKN